LDHEEKNDLLNNTIFNPMLWKEKNFDKYFKDLDVVTFKTDFKDKQNVINRQLK
jgi:hypothetical protein